MDRMHLMSVFLAVGEEQSFAGAARRLNMSPPSITRAITSLEQELGVMLLQRTTRSVRLTDAGGRYLEDVRQIMARIAEADAAVTGLGKAPQGQLSITASVLFGKLHVLPVVATYLARYPEMEVTAFFLDRIVNMVDEGIDVGVRIGPLPDSSLRALKVGKVRRMVCASPEYLARHGVPQHPDQLAAHHIITASHLSPKAEWRFGGGDDSLLIRTTPRLVVSSNDGAIEAAVLGMGICRQLSYQVAAPLAEGKLKVILEAYEEEPWPVHIVHRENRYGAAKVRLFIDLLAEALRASPALSEG